MVEQSLSPSSQSIVVQTLYAKEKFNVSNEAYHENGYDKYRNATLKFIVKKRYRVRLNREQIHASNYEGGALLLTNPP